MTEMKSESECVCVWPEQKAEASAYGQLTARCENIYLLCVS